MLLRLFVCVTLLFIAGCAQTTPKISVQDLGRTKDGVAVMRVGSDDCPSGTLVLGTKNKKYYDPVTRIKFKYKDKKKGNATATRLQLKAGKYYIIAIGCSGMGYMEKLEHNTARRLLFGGWVKVYNGYYASFEIGRREIVNVGHLEIIRKPYELAITTSNVSRTPILIGVKPISQNVLNLLQKENPKLYYRGKIISRRMKLNK